MELAPQAGNDLLRELRLGATITNARKRLTLLRQSRDRPLDVVEIGMWFGRHDARGIFVDSTPRVQSLSGAISIVGEC